MRVVPKDVRANLLWRRELCRWGGEDERAADQLMEMCRRDVVFFANAFCWLNEPRPNKGQPSYLPCVTYPYQDEALREVDACIGVEDLVVEKSRDMGASWLILIAFVRRWLFEQGQMFLLTSRNEDYVDKPGDAKSLFWKVQFLVERFPMWMLPGKGTEFTRTYMRLENHETGSQMVGEATTGNIGRGARFTAIMVDEFGAYERNAGYDVLSSTRDATPCRVFNSTLGKFQGAFEQIAQEPHRRKVTMPWWRHPEKAVGLYRDAGGKLRSPWYDYEVSRCATPQEAARELDIDYQAATSAFFDPVRLGSIATYTQRALRQGVLRHDEFGKPMGWQDDARGGARLWSSFDLNGGWPRDRDYVMGVDVSAGIGSTNSVIQVVDGSTGEQVMEFADSNLLPHQLAVVACAFGEWFAGKGGAALCVFENAGPGQVFCSSLYAMGYRRFYTKRREKEMGHPGTTSLGLAMNVESKDWMMGLFRQAVYSGGLTIRSREAVEEMRRIIYAKNGAVVHSGSLGDDPSSARKNHGDRASALALCVVGMSGSSARLGMPIMRDDRPLGDFGARLAERQRAMAQASLESGW